MITSLDLSNNEELTSLYCSYNSLTSLDISNNRLIRDINISGMTALFQVCVWTNVFPSDGVSVDSTGSIYQG